MAMKVYLEDNNIQLVHSITSAHNAISSLAAEAKNFILSKFQKLDKDYFRYVQIDTATASTFTNKNRNFNQNLHKIPYPSMLITPEITLDNPLAGTDTDPHTSSPNRWMRRDLNSYYYKLISDPNNKISMYYTTDTITTIFNFKIAVKSFIQNTDLLYFLKNELNPGFFKYLNCRSLNTEIPKTFIDIISRVLDYDVTNADDMENFRLYLLSTSRQRDSIRKKLNMSTGTYGFFMNDVVDLLTVVDSIDGPSGIIREGQTEGEYVITFRLQVTAPIVNNFILSINKKKFALIKNEVELLDSLFTKNDEEPSAPSSLAIPTSMKNDEVIYFADSNGEEHIGINIFSEFLTYDANVKSKHLNLIPLLKPKIRNIHSYMLAKNLDITTFINIRVIDQFGIRTDVEINLNTLEVDIPNITSDVLICVFVDRSVFDAITTAQQTDKNIFNDNFLTALNIKINDDNGNLVSRQAIVKSFINEAEQNSNDVNKSLRVNTIYGIGYIYLVNENDKQASKMKVCLGQDKWGNKIIKSLVLIEE